MFKAEHNGGWTLPIWHSKDRRPDLPQVKVMLSALDPLLVIRSLQHAKRAEAGLQRRIEYTRLITKFPKNSLKISEP